MPYSETDIFFPNKFRRDCNNKSCYFSFAEWLEDVYEVSKFTWTFDFRGGTLTENVIADDDFQIDSVTDLNASPTTTIEVNSSAYTLGDPISQGDEIDITVDVASVIRLNITRI